MCLARASLEGSAGAVVAVHATFRCAIHLAFSLFFLPQKNIHIQNAHALTLHVRAQGMALFYSTLSGVQVQCLVFRPGIALSGGRHRRRSLARVFCSATVRLAPSPNKMKYNKNLSQIKRQEKAKKKFTWVLEIMYRYFAHVQVPVIWCLRQLPHTTLDSTLPFQSGDSIGTWSSPLTARDFFFFSFSLSTPPSP